MGKRLWCGPASLRAARWAELPCRGALLKTMAINWSDKVEVYLIADDGTDNRPFAFEVDNAYLGVSSILSLLMQTEGVSEAVKRRMFAKSSDVHITFRYFGHEYIVWEPFGDNSRYWIGPTARQHSAPNIEPLLSTFRGYRPPLLRRLLGDLITLRAVRRLLARLLSS